MPKAFLPPVRKGRSDAPSTKRKVRAYGGDLAPPCPLRVGSSPSDFHRGCAQIPFAGRRPSAGRTVRPPRPPLLPAIRCAGLPSPATPYNRYACVWPTLSPPRPNACRRHHCVAGNPDATATTDIAVAVTAPAPALNAAFTVPLAPEGGCLRWAPRPPRITNGVYNLGRRKQQVSHLRARTARTCTRAAAPPPEPIPPVLRFHRLRDRSRGGTHIRQQHTRNRGATARGGCTDGPWRRRCCGMLSVQGAGTRVGGLWL